MEKMRLSESRREVSAVAENYLQAIYKLRERGEKVFLIRLAEVMGVSGATVVGMLKRLTRQGMISISSTKEISLAPKGLEIAQSVVRRHRLAERMLTELLNVEWYLAHEEAHRMEHAISPHVEARLIKVLGQPARCPFGHPIPGYDSDIVSVETRPLNTLEAGEQATVDRVPEEDIRLLEFFHTAGIKPDVSLQVKEVAPFKGTITVAVDGREVVLGTVVAAQVLMRMDSVG